MRVLVVGGTRFIGAAVVKELHAGNHEVVLFHRGETESEDLPPLRHIHGERAGIDQHAAAFREFAPDVALDMACMSEEDALITTAALRGIARRTVVVSSIDVYRAYGRMHGSEPGPPEPLPLSETSPVREKLYPYRGSGTPAMDIYDKIPVERAYMADPEMPGTVLRLPAVHGEGDYQRRLYVEVRRFQAGRSVIATPARAEGWIWPRAYVENIGRAIARVVTDERAIGRIYNAPVDPPLTQREWLATCARIWGWEGKVTGIPDERLPAHLQSGINFDQSMTVDDSSFRRDFGFVEDVSPEEGMRRAMAWEAERVVRDPSRLQAEFDAEDAALRG